MSRTPKVHVGARLPVELVKRVDARVQAWRVALPGIRVTRTDLIHLSLEAGLKSPSTQPPTSAQHRGD